jgi:hypothetical protein
MTRREDEVGLRWATSTSTLKREKAVTDGEGTIIYTKKCFFFCETLVLLLAALFCLFWLLNGYSILQ